MNAPVRIIGGARAVLSDPNVIAFAEALARAHVARDMAAVRKERAMVPTTCAR